MDIIKSKSSLHNSYIHIWIEVLTVALINEDDVAYSEIEFSQCDPISDWESNDMEHWTFVLSYKKFYYDFVLNILA